MEIINKTVYFETDAEFVDFCIAPYVTIKQGETVVPNGDYSGSYKQCLAEGKNIVIMDRCSEVYKLKCVTKRVPIMMGGKATRGDTLVQLPVKNLKQWLGMNVPHKFRDDFSKLISENPQISYKQIAEFFDISEERAFEFLKMWEKEHNNN